MKMTIPEGVNWTEFYWKAKAKGINIASRYVGVYACVNHKKPEWMARYQRKGQDNFLGRFPFTAQGELMAHNKYERFLQENNIKPRYAEHKRPYKRSKP